MKLPLPPILLALALVGCEQHEPEAGLEIPVELATLRSNAFQCWQDSQHAPVEHSEHCVAVAEDYFDAFREDCDGERSYECMNYNAVLSDIRDLYNSAIIEGLVKFGIPNWIKQEHQHRPFSSHAYFDGELMRRLFNECLEQEKRDLAQDGLQAITTIMDIPLQGGQRCFRLGYPEFKTAPLREL